MRSLVSAILAQTNQLRSLAFLLASRAERGVVRRLSERAVIDRHGIDLGQHHVRMDVDGDRRFSGSNRAHSFSFSESDLRSDCGPNPPRRCSGKTCQSSFSTIMPQIPLGALSITTIATAPSISGSSAPWSPSVWRQAKNTV